MAGFATVVAFKIQYDVTIRRLGRRSNLESESEETGAKSTPEKATTTSTVKGSNLNDLTKEIQNFAKPAPVHFSSK